jgi:hypothetical protein
MAPSMAPPHVRARRLFGYERRLAAWQLRRWRAASRFDIAKTEQHDGPEKVELLAAYSAGIDLALLSFVVSLVLGFLLGKLFGLIALLAVYGIGFCALAVMATIAAVRNIQSRRARDEYHRNTSGL